MAARRQILDHDLDLGEWKVYNPAAPVDPTDVVRLMDLEAAVAASGAPALSTYWVSSAAAAPTNAVNIGALADTPGELLQVAISGGVATPSLAVPGTNYPRPGSLYVVAGAGSGTTAMPSGAVNIGALGTVTGAFLKTTIAAGVASFAVDTNTYLTTAAAAATYQPIGSYYATVQQGGTPLTQRTTINFTGSGVTVSDVSGVTTVNITAGTGLTQAYQTVQANGTNLNQRNTLNVLPRLVAADVSSPASTTLDLASGIATPGTYTSVTVDTYGRVTGGTNPTIYYQTMKDSAGSSLTQRANLKHAARFAVTDSTPDTLVDLATSGASAGSYTNANVTVDVYGRITTVANGTSGAYLGTVAGAIPFTGSTPFALTEDDTRLRYETGAFSGSGTMSRLYVGAAPSLSTSTSIGSAIHLYTVDQALQSVLRLQGGTAEVQGWQGTNAGGTEIPISTVRFIDGPNGSTSGAVRFSSRQSTAGGGALIDCGGFEGGGAIIAGALMVGTTGVDESLNGQSFIQFQQHGSPGTAPSGTARLYYNATSARLLLSNTTGAYSAVATLADLSGGTGPTGSAGGDLGGTYPNPTVLAIHETSGPTKLTFGAVADGNLLVRSGSTIVSLGVTAVGANQVTYPYFINALQLLTISTTGTPAWFTTSSPTSVFASAAEYLIGGFEPAHVAVYVSVRSNTSATSSLTIYATRNGSTIGSGVAISAGSTGDFSDTISLSGSSGDKWGLVGSVSGTPDGTISFSVTLRVMEAAP